MTFTLEHAISSEPFSSSDFPFCTADGRTWPDVKHFLGEALDEMTPMMPTVSSPPPKKTQEVYRQQWISIRNVCFAIERVETHLRALSFHLWLKRNDGCVEGFRSSGWYKFDDIFLVTGHGGHMAVVLQDMGQFMSGAVAFQWSMVVISAFLIVETVGLSRDTLSI